MCQQKYSQQYTELTDWVNNFKKSRRGEITTHFPDKCVNQQYTPTNIPANWQASMKIYEQFTKTKQLHCEQLSFFSGAAGRARMICACAYVPPTSIRASPIWTSGHLPWPTTHTYTYTPLVRPRTASILVLCCVTQS